MGYPNNAERIDAILMQVSRINNDVEFERVSGMPSLQMRKVFAEVLRAIQLVYIYALKVLKSSRSGEDGAHSLLAQNDISGCGSARLQDVNILWDLFASNPFGQRTPVSAKISGPGPTESVGPGRMFFPSERRPLFSNIAFTFYHLHHAEST